MTPYDFALYPTVASGTVPVVTKAYHNSEKLQKVRHAYFMGLKGQNHTMTFFS
jgi:hypothetical protein